MRGSKGAATRPPPFAPPSRLRFDSPPRPHRPCGHDGLPQRALQLPVRSDRLARALAAVAQRRTGE